MGCFLQCFGLSTKRKRRKTLYKVLAAGAGEGDQKYGTYQVLALTEKSIIPYSEFRGSDEHKEKNVVKSKKKKKVTFNLNLQIYEPNPNSYQVLDNEEDEEETKDTTVESEGEGSAALAVSFPSNHRYSNCTYDEDEDEIAYEESDIDDNEFDDDEYDWDDNDDDDNDDDDDDDDDGSDESLENGAENSEQKESCSPNDAELKSSLSGRERSINMHSVLIPVENLTQWKAIKAKVTSSKHRRKENVPSDQNTSTSLVSEASLNYSPRVLESNALQSKPLLQEIAVDASLSNWLVSPKSIRCQ